MNLCRWLVPLLLGVLVTACATGPEPDELHFGAAVRHMISVQTYAPGAQVAPLDGEKAEGVVRAYRADVAGSEEPARGPVRIEVGR